MPGGKTGRWIALSLLLLAGAAACAAPEEPDCGTVRVGLRDYPRIYQRDAKGEYQGLDREFFEALGQRSGCHWEIQVDSQPRVWQGVRAGRIDLTSWAIPSEERGRYVNVIPLLIARPMAVTWRDSPVRSEAEFLADGQLRAVRIRQSLYGTGYDNLFEQLRGQGRLSEAADFDTAVHVFTARRMDLIVAYPWALITQPESWLNQVRFSDWHADSSTVQSGLALSRSLRADQAKRIEDAVRAMQRDGSLARIVARHLPMDLVKMAPPPPATAAVN